MNDERVQLIEELADKQALRDLVHKLSRAIDRADEELLISCYHEDAYDDHGSFQGSPLELVEYLKSRTMDPSIGPMQHAVTNSWFTIDGDAATGESYVEVRVVDENGVLQRSVWRYIDRFERRNGEWKIAVRRAIPRRAALATARPISFGVTGTGGIPRTRLRWRAMPDCPLSS